MDKRKAVITEVKTIDQVPMIQLEKEITNKTLEDLLEKLKVPKLAFAKVSWGTGKGPYILAFEDEATYDYCECNSHDFKSVHMNELKNLKEVPIWSCGMKTPEQINELPKMNIEKAKAKLIQDKEDRKKARAEKMKATKAGRKVKDS